jgi:hypothetical protein
VDESHFQREVERLCERFGAQHYKPGFQKLLWKDVRDLPNSWFSYVISEFIYCSRQAPLGDDFRVKISDARQKEWSDKLAKDTFDNFDATKKSCIYCNHVGTLVHEGYAYVCFCSAGQKRPEKYPVFKPTR